MILPSLSRLPNIQMRTALNSRGMRRGTMLEERLQKQWKNRTKYNTTRQQIALKKQSCKLTAFKVSAVVLHPRQPEPLSSTQSSSVHFFSLG